MYCKAVLPLFLIAGLVDNVRAQCDPKLVNPSTRAEYFACAREHTPQIIWDMIQDCVPQDTDLETLYADACQYEKNNPQSAEFVVCIERKSSERHAELREVGRTAYMRPFQDCLANIPDPNTDI